MKQVKTQNNVTKGWKVLLNRYKKYKTSKKKSVETANLSMTKD